MHALDAAGAKVRLLRCNAASGLSELEEAWVVRSLYREDKLDQPHIAQLLGRHKSWVCRRLTLAEGLSDELTAQGAAGAGLGDRGGGVGAVAALQPGRRGPGGDPARADDAADGAPGRCAARGATGRVAEAAGAIRAGGDALPKGGAPSARRASNWSPTSGR